MSSGTFSPRDFPALTAWLCRHVPALDSLRGYSRGDLVADVLAGLTVATVAVPQAMAYALLAGLPPQYGLYTAIVMTAVGALLDSSRQLINGPTNAISIALLSALAVVPPADRPGAAILFAFLVGLIQLGITVLRLGDLTRYISHAVIIGFTLGAGTLLVLDQLKNLVGLPSRGEPEDHFLRRFWLSLTAEEGWHGLTTLVGIGTIVLVISIRRLNGLLYRRGMRFPLPQHLLAVSGMAALVWALDLQHQGLKVVGAIPPSLPHFELPPFHWEHTRLLVGNAFGVAILGLLEAIAMAKAIAAGTRQKLDINQQCLSEGAANMVGSFFQGMPGSGSLTRSAVNRQAGAVSQWSGVFAAGFVAATVLLFAPLAAYIPRASLAGLLLLAAFRMVEWRQLLFHLRSTRFDALIVVATALAAVLISVEFCILIGVFFSFVLYIPRAARVQMGQLTLDATGQLREGHQGLPPCERLLLYHLEGELFFGAAPDVEEHFAAIEQQVHKETRAVILFLERARNPDAAFLGLLGELHRRLQERGVMLILSGVSADLAHGLWKTGLQARIGPEQVLGEGHRADGRIPEAIRRAYALLGQDLCPSCPRRREQGHGLLQQGPFSF